METIQKPHWPGALVTIVEMEFHHIMIDSDAHDEASRFGPHQSQLHEGLVTPVKSLTSNGLLIWLPDGSLVHGDWLAEQKEFSRRDGKSNLALSDVRAWTVLPHPIATA